MKYTLALVTLLLLTAIGCSNSEKNKFDTLPYFVPETDELGDVMTDQSGDTLWHTIPAFNFVDQDGNEIDQSVMKNKVVVADYFFTTCPSICIAMTKNLGKVQNRFKGNKDLVLLSHTVNPKKDTPEVLKAYANLQKADLSQWHFLTGEKEVLYEHARKGYFITTIEGDGGPDDFIHSEKLVLIDREGHIRGFYRGTVDEDVEELIKGIEILLKS